MRMRLRLCAGVAFACLAFAVGSVWAGPLRPVETLATFSDEAQMTTTISLAEKDLKPATAVAFNNQGQILAANASSAAIYDAKSEKWSRIAAPQFELKQIAWCGTRFVGTDGENWLASPSPGPRVEGGWDKLEGPFTKTTLLVGTARCAAYDGQGSWQRSEDGGDSWIAPKGEGRPTGTLVAGSQAMSTLLATNGQDVWRSGNMGDQWTRISLTFGNIKPLMVETAFIRVGGRWCGSIGAGQAEGNGQGDGSAWAETELLDNLDIGEPFAAGTLREKEEAIDRVIVTDGSQWESVNLKGGEVTSFDPPPLY